MEVVESPLANVIVAISLLSCFMLLLSLPIRNFLISKGWRDKNVRIIELFLRYIPLLLFLVLFLRYLFAHIFLDNSHLHVAYHLDSNSELINRIASLFAGYDGASLMLMFVIIITHLISIKIIKIRNRDMVDRWFSLVWIICLTGILPEQTFEMTNGIKFAPVTNDLLFQSAKGGFFASLLFGILIGLGPHIMEFNQNEKTSKQFLMLFGLVGMSSILLGPLEYLTPLANNNWDATLFSELEISRLGAIVTTLMLFTIFPIVIYYSENLDSKIPAGINRSIGLAVSIFLGLLFVIMFSMITLSPEWSNASIFYELLAELFPILLFALIFSLMPIIGLDERSRPELHGWRYGLFVGVILGCLNSSLISLSLLNGCIIALILSLTLPLIIEKSPLLNSKIKLVNTITSIVTIILAIALNYLFSDLHIILPLLGIFTIFMMEINNIQLPKGNQLE